MPFKVERIRRAYQSTYQRKYYSARKAQALERNRRRKKNARRFLWDRKREQPCVQCGESDIRCLDFHHRGDERKAAGLALLATNGAAIRTLERELEKCIVLCKNCHAKEHFKHMT